MALNFKRHQRTIFQINKKSYEGQDFVYHFIVTEFRVQG